MIILKHKCHPEHRNKQKDRDMNSHTSDGGSKSTSAPKFISNYSISTDVAQIAIFWKNNYLWVMFILKHNVMRSRLLSVSPFSN